MGCVVQMTETPTLLIDSNYLGHQARHTLGTLTYGESATGVIFGFLSRVLSLGRMFLTNDIVFCWDSKHSFRKKSCPSYKAKRRAEITPEERRELESAFKQFDMMRRSLLPAIGFRNNFLQCGLEADDLLAKVVEGYATKLDLIIISADEDLLQLLRRNVKIFNPSQKKIMTEKRFHEERGIFPTEWATVKQIAGCSSDCIAGVKGVGEMTAIKFITGQLPKKSKRYKSIQSDLRGISEREKLVKLPHTRTQPIELEQNHYDIAEFCSICNQFGMESFLSEDRFKEWKQLFNGDLKRDKPKITITKP